MRLFTTILIFIASFFIFSCTPKAQTKTATSATISTKKVIANPIEVLSAVDFKQRIEADDVQLVDIKTQGEFIQGHIEGALNFDYYKRTFISQMSTLDKTKPVYIYCRSGNRTGSASKKLKKAGFTKIYDLKGGTNHWTRAGFTLIK